MQTLDLLTNVKKRKEGQGDFLAEILDFLYLLSGVMDNGSEDICFPWQWILGYILIQLGSQNRNRGYDFSYISSLIFILVCDNQVVINT